MENICYMNELINLQKILYKVIFKYILKIKEVISFDLDNFMKKSLYAFVITVLKIQGVQEKIIYFFFYFENFSNYSLEI